MRVSLLAVPASLLLLASPAGAQSGNYPLQEAADIATVQVTAPFRLSEEESTQVSGTYAMSNGWRLKVEPASDKAIHAQIDRQRPIRLIALSADKFVSPDGNVAMDFNRGRDRDEMVMSYVPNPGLAQQYVVIATATLAQR